MVSLGDVTCDMSYLGHHLSGSKSQCAGGSQPARVRDRDTTRKRRETKGMCGERHRDRASGDGEQLGARRRLRSGAPSTIRPASAAAVRTERAVADSARGPRTQRPPRMRHVRKPEFRPGHRRGAPLQSSFLQCWVQGKPS